MRRAICVGVSVQADSSLASLKQCKYDIDRFSRFLESDLGDFKVETILNPSSLSIKAKLWKVVSDLNPDDHLLIYFSGHGRRNVGRKLQLCLHDTDPEALVVTSISFDEVLNICNEAGAESTLIMLDCCFSGAAERSIIAKGSDEILVPHEDAILSSKGLSVLSSCSSVELSYADDKTNLSSFTSSLLELCERKTNQISGWLTVGQIYEELRFSVRSHSPKLIGNNPTFPICRGRKAISPAPITSEIELRAQTEKYALLYGILIMPSYRAWLIDLPPENVPQDSERIARDVYVVYNSQELYPNKLNHAKQYIENTLADLEYLSNFLGSTILLLYPVAIEEAMYRRFQGSDRRYILRAEEKLKKKHYPVLSPQQYGYTVSGSEGDFSIHQIPDDYLREAFGIVVDQDGSSLMFREDSFSQNSKYLKIESYTNRVLDSLTFGRSSDKTKLSFNSTPAESQQFETTVNYSRVRPLKERKLGEAFLVESNAQSRKAKRKYDAQCQLCLDERFRYVSVNNRTYRVPCKSCNSDFDNSWKAFPDL